MAVGIKEPDNIIRRWVLVCLKINWNDGRTYIGDLYIRSSAEFPILANEVLPIVNLEVNTSLGSIRVSVILKDLEAHRVDTHV
jgi:hypothetical protein